jgi:hypothetical protein
LSNPPLIWMGCATRRMHTATAMLDEEQHVQRLQRGCFYRKEIASQDLFFVVVEKGAGGRSGDE